MKTLLVATNEAIGHRGGHETPPAHQRVDYLELARRLKAEYVDYAAVREGKAARWVERMTRLDFRLAREVTRLVRHRRFDLVVSLSERVGLPLAPMLARGIHHVVIVHHPISPPKLRLMALLGVRARWDRIVAISEAEAAELRRALNLPEGRVVSLLTPVDTDFFRPLEPPVPLARQDHVQSLGLSHRDYPTLLRAMRALPDIPCHLRVGSAWVDHRSGHEGEEIPPNVQIKPFVPPNLLRQSCAESRFLIVPIRASTQWSAGCTTVQIAQAMGKAVIASDRPGLASYLINGETGILVRTGDAKDMAAAIEYLWRNPNVATEMGRRGREWVVASQSMDRWLEKMADILSGLAGTGARAGR